MKFVAALVRHEVSKAGNDRLILRFGTLQLTLDRVEAIQLATDLADVAAELV